MADNGEQGSLPHAGKGWGWIAWWSQYSKASHVTSVTQGSRMENEPRPELSMGAGLKGIGHCDLAQLLVTLGGPRKKE